MKKRILSILAIIGIGMSAQAQNAWVYDSVSMGAGSMNDIYYSMSNGQVKAENNMNWHLAFSMNAGDSSAIWANHNAGNAFVKVYNTHKDKSQWGAITLADTATSSLCYNMDQKWSQGALNDIPSADPFNFGWGTYDMVSHNVVGDSIFIVKANNVFYKVIIDSLQSMLMTYHYRVGDIAANTTNTYSIAKGSKYANSIFAYVNIANGMDSLREPNITTWDIVFNRYNSLVLLGPPPAVPYSVVGALGNRTVNFGRAQAVHVDTAHNNYGNYTNPWNTSISGVGYDWKTFTPPAGPWTIADSNSYFVKDVNGLIYQLQFLNYSGSGSGNISFRKRQLYPTKVVDFNSNINEYTVFPNPAQNNINIVMDAKAAGDAQLSILDYTGKLISTSSVKIQQGINAFVVPVNTLANGNYILHLNGKNIQVKEKVVVAK